MTSDNDNSQKLNSTVEAVKEIVSAVPVYNDVVSPAAKEVGKSLQTIAKTINIALAPVGALVWGYERACEFLNKKLCEKLKDVPPENIVTPKSNIAVPVLQALTYSGDDLELQEMFANLLAAAMKSETSQLAHPSFVEIIKQMTSEEARLIMYCGEATDLPIIHISGQDKEGEIPWATNVTIFHERLGIESHDNLQSSIDNLLRLGLIQIEDKEYVDRNLYKEILDHKDVKFCLNELKKEGRAPVFYYQKLDVTNLGRRFIEVVGEKNIKA